MKVCIAEKPSVAADLAKVLGADRRREGFFEGPEYCVTWTFGHLCTLKEPHDYIDRWKHWSLGQLPMIPPRFGIKLMDDEGVRKQFKIISELFSKAEMIINCGDAGQEGELIQRWVMQLAEVKCPVMRLWISSLTEDSIREGFASLKPQEQYNNLYYAGLARAIGDWILGMNATRLYSLKYSQPGHVLSVGRVQTPTLAMIVRRHFEIQNFVPVDTWELHTSYRDVDFASSKKFEKEEMATALADAIKDKLLEIVEITKKNGSEAPPRLFDLTSLQVETNKLWGWSADETLRLIQSLYEKKVTTYPRVDTTYLSEDIYPKVPGILRKMTPYAPQTAPILANKIPKSKKVFDNAKVTDHHAIIPTGESPERLVGNERQLYHLIALRFIAAFYPDCRFSQTTVVARVDDIDFKATGKVITSPGWRVILKKQEQPGDKSEDRILPDFLKGESGSHVPKIVKKTSTPPKLYTEGTLLRAMETAGRSVDDETLREALKENGIGRPSTRAAIIETLFRRHYIAHSGKSIVATQAGIDLIATINNELLKSASLTGIWEKKLRQISIGEYQATTFVEELKEMINQIVLEVLNDNSARKIDTTVAPEQSRKSKSKSADQPKRTRRPAVKSFDQIKCPMCGQGHILQGRTAFGCSRYADGCTLRLPFDQYPASLTPAQLAAKLRKK